MKKKTIVPLFDDDDIELVRPVLEQLKEKGIHIKEKGEVKQDQILLLFLSKNFAVDEDAQERFFAADSANCAVIPVDLDGAPQPELIRSALIARNAIMAIGRTPEEIAARVTSAEVFKTKTVSGKLGRVFIIAAIILALGTGVWVWKKWGGETAEDILSFGKGSAPVPNGYGLTEKDLGKIGGVIVLGNRFLYYTPEELPPWQDLIYTVPNEDGTESYRLKEDGSPVQGARYEDLSVLALMPKLSRLTLIETDVGQLPDLSASETLEELTLLNCSGIPDLNWVAGSSLKSFTGKGTQIGGYSALNACEGLELVDLLVSQQKGEKIDLSGFGPKSLKALSVEGESGAIAQSALADCKELRELHLYNLADVEDLAFLREAKDLRSLEIRVMPALNDISAVGSLEGLEELIIDKCGEMKDFSAIAGCKSLKTLELMFSGEGSPVVELPSLADLEALDTIRMYTNVTTWTRGNTRTVEAARLKNLDFLKECKGGEDGLSLTLSIFVDDYSALSALKKYGTIGISATHCDDPGKILQQLRDSEIDSLALEMGNVWRYENGSERVNVLADLDMDALPRNIRKLTIGTSALEDLQGLPEKVVELSLHDCPRLRSLKGLENSALARGGEGSLEIGKCPSLYDWSALRGVSLDLLNLHELTSLPEPESLRCRKLYLEQIAWVDGESFLEQLVANGPKSYEQMLLISVEGLYDLLPLYELKTVDTMYVSPDLREQANDLLNDDVVMSYYVYYSAASWDPGMTRIPLGSFEELRSMPERRLSRITSAAFYGDRVDDAEACQVDGSEYRKTGVPFLVRLRTGERSEIAAGPIRSVGELGAMSALQELVLCNQPIESLEGIQSFSELLSAKICCCAELRDVSAVFTLQQLQELDLSFTPLDSLQGVENLQDLRSLDLRGTAVKDLKPVMALGLLEHLYVSSDMRAAIASLGNGELPFSVHVE